LSNSNDLIIKPYPHQQETINNLNREFKKGNTKQLVVLPSGSGKTHTIAFHVKKLKPKTFLYVVHRDAIVTQTIKVFKKTIPWLKDEDIGIVNQKSKDYDKPFIFATIQTLSHHKNLSQLKRQKKKLEYVVIDEYHHVAAPTYKRLIKSIKEPTYLVGLTATPYRLDKKDIFSFVNNNIVHSIDLFEGISKKILVPFHYIGLHDDIDYSTIRFNGYQYNTGDLDRKLIIHKRDDAVIDEYFKKIDKDNRTHTIIFCNSVEHIKRMSDRFNKEGVKAAGIWHKQDNDVRKNLLELFRQGYYKVLLTRDILNEGVDFPECSALMFLRPTISKTIFLQQLGRGLRKNYGKKDVLVLDFVGNYHKAFEKRHWFLSSVDSNVELKKYTGEYIKPVYEYDHPKPVIEFDSKVIELMDLQERYYKSYTERGQRVTHNEKELIDNYNNVKRYWKSLNKTNKKQFINNPPPLRLFDDPQVSKYNFGSYSIKYGTYSNFLKTIGEFYETDDKDAFIITAWDNYNVRIKKLKICVSILQKKLGRKYFTAEEWRKEFGPNGGVFITRKLGGFKKMRELFKIPEGVKTKCIVCGKYYMKRACFNRKNTVYACSITCRHKYTALYDKKYKTNLESKRQQRLQIIIPCNHCGKSINKYRLDQKNNNRLIHYKYCSHKCSMNAYFKRQEHKSIINT
jgi:superfamily II DNA or RNA helicase